jgi:hypothetical protein
MKNKILFFLVFFFLSFGIKAQKSVIASLNSTDLGSVDNEAYIKFNFQGHSYEKSTEYNIAYFERALSISESGSHLEFWGHGFTTLSIFGPIQVNLTGEDIKSFSLKMRKHYEEFQKNIRLKLKTFEHSDVILLTETGLIFSCYMNNKTAEYAFWVDQKKYLIDEKSLLLFYSKLESYFK